MVGQSWYGVVMAGGGGTRLWPSSRPGRPKQLMTVQGAKSLLTGAVDRAAALVGRSAGVVVVTRADQVEPARGHMPDLGDDQILAEPIGRNTAPCIGLSATVLLHRDPEAVIAVLPADHFIADVEGFVATCRAAMQEAETGGIVTVGIRPDHPETGYGYIEMGDVVNEARAVHHAVRFVEKPDLETARTYLASGRYLWNSGMFFMRADRILAEIRDHMPDLAQGLDRIAAGLDHGDGAYREALAQVYPDLEPVSIDYGVMEKVADMKVIPGQFGWNDVGSWAALEQIHDADSDGNISVGSTVTLDDHGCIVVSDDERPVAVLGVQDLVVVSSQAGVLVIPKSRVQEVRRIVAELKAAGKYEP
ncbi:MAG: mannose-1-phosphate guanylyltransferase [Deltaproteobacteria bacterium]|nr:mannose-1-phosphate guanylyltransferase [Deltaproteobacteria bacterium]